MTNSLRTPSILLKPLETSRRRKQDFSYHAAPTAADINGLLTAVQVYAAEYQKTLHGRTADIKWARTSWLSAGVYPGDRSLFDVLFESLSLDDYIWRSIAWVAHQETARAASINIVNDIVFLATNGSVIMNLSPPLGTALVSPMLDTLTSPYAVSEAQVGLMITVFTALLKMRYGGTIIASQ